MSADLRKNITCDYSHLIRMASAMDVANPIVGVSLSPFPCSFQGILKPENSNSISNSFERKCFALEVLYVLGQESISNMEPPFLCFVFRDQRMDEELHKAQDHGAIASKTPGRLSTHHVPL